MEQQGDRKCNVENLLTGTKVLLILVVLVAVDFMLQQRSCGNFKTSKTSTVIVSYYIIIIIISSSSITGDQWKDA